MAKPATQMGGSAILPGTLPPANAAAPNEWVFVVEWVSDDEPRPVDLQIDTFRIPPTGQTDDFPPRAPLLHASAFGLSGVPGTTGIVRLELGQGPNARTLYCDLKSGRFALGSQTRVRVSMCRWLTAEPSNDAVRVQIGISETDGSGEYLTYTMVRSEELIVGDAFDFSFPPGAAWWEFYSDGDWVAYEAASADNLGYAARFVETSPPVYTPPSSPLPVTYQRMTLENVGTEAAAITVVVWVR